jgi:hypothetical protein
MTRWLGMARSEVAAWTLVLGVALGLRLWGTDFGLPHVYHPDEGFEVYRALRLGMGGYDFERVAKGGYYLLLFAEYAVYFVFQLATGAIASVGDFARGFIADPAPFWRIGRTTTALLGTATVLLVGLHARRSAGVLAGLLAAWFLATSFQHVVDSHTITVDVPMTLFAFAAIVMIVEDACGRSRLRSVPFAVLAAYAIMNKLPAALLFVPYFIGAGMRGGFRGPRGLTSRETWGPVFLTIVIYLLLNPGFVVRFKDMVELVSHTVGGATEKSEEYGAVPLEVNLAAFYARTILASQGPAVVALAAWGLVAGLLRRRREVILHGAFLAAFFALIAGTSSSHLYYGRYVLPLLPGLCILAAFALADLVGRVRAPARTSAVLASIVAVLLVLEPALASIRWDLRLARVDTRTMAAEWIEARVPDGARVLLEGFPEETAQLAIPLQSSPAQIRGMIDTLRTTDPGKSTFWNMKLEAWKPPGYELVTVRHFEDWPRLEDIRENDVEWILVRREFFVPGARHATKFASSTVETRFAFYEALTSASDAERVAAFEADPDGAPGYDIEIWKLEAAVPESAR